MKYYRRNTNPLIGLSEDKIQAGEIVYNELGKCVRKMYLDDNIYFTEVIESVLNDGETMTELTPTQIDLFWKLSRNKYKKYEDQIKDTGKYIFS